MKVYVVFILEMIEVEVLEEGKGVVVGVVIVLLEVFGVVEDDVVGKFVVVVDDVGEEDISFVVFVYSDSEGI